MSDNMFSKMCDLCNLQPAVLFFRTFNGESIGEEGLCPQCAMKRFSSNSPLGNNSEENEEILHSINAMRNILSDIVGHINKISTQHPEVEKEHDTENCPVCRSSYTDIIEYQIGCNYCFELFNTPIKELVHENSFSNKHLGNVPTRLRKDYFKTIELEKLRLKLQSLVRLEEYEEAAKIQKRISKLEQ
ncbi:MAG: hypothetical protein ACRCVW_06860 [Brevinema sp.]